MRIFCSILMILVLFLYPEGTTQAARSAVLIWGKEVVPSLFPYMVLSKQLSASIRNTKAAAFAPLLLGLLGGSPSGAAAIVEIDGISSSRRKLFALCTLTGTISPMFVAITAGGWLGGGCYGVKLLAAHWLGTALAAFLVFVWIRSAENIFPVESIPRGTKKNEPIRDSVYAVLGVGGCIVFYSVMASSVSWLLSLPPECAALVQGVLEISAGAKALSELAIAQPVKLVLCAGVFGFSGISILSQNLMFLQTIGIRMGNLVCFGILRSLCAMLLMCAILAFFP